MLAELESRQEPIELTDVAFHPQVTDQCGPAALATVLEKSGVTVSPDELRSRIYIPQRQGSLQIELLAATRHYKRIPYALDRGPGAILRELEAGRPVLVLQNLGVQWLPTWHYAVIVGYLPDSGEFVLRSGDRERHLLRARTFMRTWQRGDYWAIVVLQPGELPADADAERYLRAVAALEAIGDAATAVAAYREATVAWPQNKLGWLGLGNAAYSTGELAAARSAYRQLLAIDPADPIALNNLAQVSMDLGCRDEALATIYAALSLVESGDSLYASLQETLSEILHSESAAICH